MRRGRGFLLVCSFAVCLPGAALAEAVAKTEVGTGKGQIAVFRLHGLLLEKPPEFDLGFDLEPKPSLHNLLERLRKARKDDNVKAVVFSFDEPLLGRAQMQELRQAIADLRGADKDVYCYLESADAGTYQLAAAGSRVCIAPTGLVALMGLHAEQAYFKGLLDKIHVEADIEHMGSYKGAGEPFTRTGPSDEAREMMEWLVQDLYEQMVDTISKSRQIPKEEVDALISRGPLLAPAALEAKLVDELAYAEEFVESLKKRYGEGVKFSHDYGEDKIPEIDFSNPFAIFKFIGETVSGKKTTRGESVAIVYVDGMIVTGKTEEGLFGDSGTVGSTTIRRVLNKVAEDDSVKAVVLRVDSPGGSALASDIMWHATQTVRVKKPLVVSMGNVAASGGYYISAGSSAIFADAGTITGSIGVIGGKLVTKGLWDWAGVSFHETQRGKHADLFNSNRKFTDEERAIIQRLLKDVYGDFTDRVRKGRGDRLKKDLEQIAGGRVYTGRQALALGLVDKLGGLQDAVKFAAAEASISDYEIRVFPEPKTFMDIFKNLSGREDDQDNVEINLLAAPPGWTLQSPPVSQLLSALESVDPLRARSVLRSLLRIELLGREHTLLALPAEITIR